MCVWGGGGLVVYTKVEKDQLLENHPTTPTTDPHATTPDNNHQPPIQQQSKTQTQTQPQPKNERACNSWTWPMRVARVSIVSSSRAGWVCTCVVFFGGGGVLCFVFCVLYLLWWDGEVLVCVCCVCVRLCFVCFAFVGGTGTPYNHTQLSKFCTSGGMWIVTRPWQGQPTGSCFTFGGGTWGVLVVFLFV